MNDTELDIQVCERTIRDMAAGVITSCVNRRTHPSYGYSKTKIRADGARLEGAIGLYMVLTNQAAHAGVPGLATFHFRETMERVEQARQEQHRL